MKHWKEAFNSRPFTFEEFRDQIIAPECIFGQDPDKVTEASITMYLQEGYIDETRVGDKIWYIRTGKKLPTPKKKDEQS